MDNWSDVSFNKLISLLKNDANLLANKEVARRVVKNDPPVVNYYLGPMNEGLVLKLNSIMARDTYADLFLFLGKPFDESTGKPLWHKIALYDARDCSLKSYTSRIACRHFYKIANKEKKVRERERELLDYRDYESLLKCDQPEEDGDNITHIRMKRAFRKLKERDQKALQYLVIDKMHGLDAYPLLEEYIHPKPKDGMTSEEVKKAWTSKQKQDAVSLMKGRALEYLLEKYNEEKLNHK